MNETVLIIHILSAAAWIGGSMLLGIVAPKMGRAGGPAAGAWIGVVLEVVPRFFIPAAVLTLASGATLVLIEDAWAWSDAFVGIGIAIVVVALAIALLNNVPSLKRMASAAASGDMPTVAVNARKVKVGGSTITLLLIAAEIAMVLRLGA